MLAKYRSELVGWKLNVGMEIVVVQVRKDERDLRG